VGIGEESDAALIFGFAAIIVGMKSFRSCRSAAGILFVAGFPTRAKCCNVVHEIELLGGVHRSSHASTSVFGSLHGKLYLQKEPTARKTKTKGG